MRIPDKVKVGSVVYDVRRVGHPLCVGQKECAGSITYGDALIEVRTDIHCEQVQYLTFLHELIHAMSRERGLEWADNDELYTEELAKALHSVIVDNPDMFRSAE